MNERAERINGWAAMIGVIAAMKTMTVSRSNTVTTEDGGRTNLWATEPRMYIDQTAAERYGYETYAEKAEKLNGRTAMLGFAAAIISYATTGSVFFFGALGF